MVYAMSSQKNFGTCVALKLFSFSLGVRFRAIIYDCKPSSYALSNDVERRRRWYLSDWTDGIDNINKVAPAICFLYFASLIPAISFGTIASQLTGGAMGIVEFLLGCGLGGAVSGWRSVFTADWITY